MQFERRDCGSIEDEREMIKGVFMSGDVLSLCGLTSKILPLDSMLNFDADVKKITARHQCENP